MTPTCNPSETKFPVSLLIVIDLIPSAFHTPYNDPASFRSVVVTLVATPAAFALT